ncbi:hypothetical protein [Nocardiopsis dassonvillei]|uniref:hypothetical protein n=1 Tax=Nocardiopsis dassonvillei TaxID=2014 RepID=UPI00363FF08A
MPTAQPTAVPDPLTEALADGRAEPTIVHPGDVLILRFATSQFITKEIVAKLKSGIAERLGQEPIVLVGVDELAVYRPDRVRAADEGPPAPAHTYTVYERGNGPVYQIDADWCRQSMDHTEYLFVREGQDEPVARVAADTVASIRCVRR